VEAVQYRTVGGSGYRGEGGERGREGIRRITFLFKRKRRKGKLERIRLSALLVGSTTARKKEKEHIVY